MVGVGSDPALSHGLSQFSVVENKQVMCDCLHLCIVYSSLFVLIFFTAGCQIPQTGICGAINNNRLQMF